MTTWGDWVMRESGLLGTDRLVALAIAYCHDEGMQTPPLSTVQAWAGLSLRSVQESVGRLVARGVAVRIEGGGRGEQTRVWLETTQMAQSLRNKNHANGASNANGVVNPAPSAEFPVVATAPSSPPSLSPEPPISSPPIPPTETTKKNGKGVTGGLARRRAPPSDAVPFPETFNVTKGMWTWTQNEGMPQEFVMQETKIWVADWRSTSETEQLAQGRSSGGWMFAWQGHLLKHWKAEQRYSQSRSSRR